MKYEEAVTQFSKDHASVFETHDHWVDCEVVADLTCESEATKLKAEEDKRQCEVEEVKMQVEEAKANAAQDMGGCPKKQVCANTVGSSFAEALMSGVRKELKVCLYCTKWGKFCLHFPFSSCGAC